jgi:RNA polymerase sigma-70 factor (ECF subfamily)
MRMHHPRDVALSRSAVVHGDEEYRALMARYQAGEAEAFEALYETFAPVLVAYLEALAPGLGSDETVVEQVFLAIHRARRSYDPRRPFQPWAEAVARHVARAWRRGQPPSHARRES